MSDLRKRYDRFGWDYPHHAPLTEEEVAWYVKYARETGGPVLDVPCGTGRLLCRIAEAGFEVAGIDLSDTMLDIARKNVAELPPEARARTHLLKADMSDFRLDREFGLVIIADNSFRELTDRESQLRCLRLVREHLRPDGVFLMTERRFDRHLYRDGKRTFGWSPPLTNPDTGETVRRRGDFELADDGRRMRGAFTYEVTRPDGSVHIEECPIEGPIYRMDDYLGLFAEARLTAKAYADYTDRPADGTEKLTCFVCEAAR